MPTDVQVIAKFSAWKTLALCSVIMVGAAVSWAYIPSLDPYLGNRFSPEIARFLLFSATAIFTAFLPLVAWHVWNWLSQPGALYISDGRLFIYWAYFQSVSVQQIVDAVDEGRSNAFGDRVRLSVSGRADVRFETTFMAKSGGGVVALIKATAATRLRD